MMPLIFRRGARVVVVKRLPLPAAAAMLGVRGTVTDVRRAAPFDWVAVLPDGATRAVWLPTEVLRPQDGPRCG